MFASEEIRKLQLKHLLSLRKYRMADTSNGGMRQFGLLILTARPFGLVNYQEDKHNN